MIQCLSWEDQSTFIKAQIPLFRVRIESQKNVMTCTKYFTFSLVADIQCNPHLLSSIKLSYWFSERWFQKVCNMYLVCQAVLCQNNIKWEMQPLNLVLYWQLFLPPNSNSLSPTKTCCVLTR